MIRADHGGIVHLIKALLDELGLFGRDCGGHAGREGSFQFLELVTHLGCGFENIGPAALFNGDGCRVHAVYAREGDILSMAVDHRGHVTQENHPILILDQRAPWRNRPQS